MRALRVSGEGNCLQPQTRQCCTRAGAGTLHGLKTATARRDERREIAVESGLLQSIESCVVSYFLSALDSFWVARIVRESSMIGFGEAEELSVRLSYWPRRGRTSRQISRPNKHFCPALYRLVWFLPLKSQCSAKFCLRVLEG